MYVVSVEAEYCNVTETSVGTGRENEPHGIFEIVSGPIEFTRSRSWNPVKKRAFCGPTGAKSGTVFWAHFLAPPVCFLCTGSKKRTVFRSAFSTLTAPFAFANVGPRGRGQKMVSPKLSYAMLQYSCNVMAPLQELVIINVVIVDVIVVDVVVVVVVAVDVVVFVVIVAAVIGAVVDVISL